MKIPAPPPPPDLALIEGLGQHQSQQNVGHPGATHAPQGHQPQVEAVVAHDALGTPKRLAHYSPGV